MKEKNKPKEECSHKWEILEAKESYGEVDATKLLEMLTNPKWPTLHVKEICRKCWKYRVVIAKHHA